MQISKTLIQTHIRNYYSLLFTHFMEFTSIPIYKPFKNWPKEAKFLLDKYITCTRPHSSINTKWDNLIEGGKRKIKEAVRLKDK